MGEGVKNPPPLACQHSLWISPRAPCLDQLSNTYSNLVTIRAFKEQRRVFNQFCDSVNANTTGQWFFRPKIANRFLEIHMFLIWIFSAKKICLMDSHVFAFKIVIPLQDGAKPFGHILCLFSCPESRNPVSNYVIWGFFGCENLSNSDICLSLILMQND